FMHLSVIVPVYNEEKNLANSIHEFTEFLRTKKYTWEIIIVNDGSTDNTEKIVEDLKRSIPNLRFINNKTNRGKGAAVRQGFLEGRGDFRLFLDADNATTIDHVDKIWPMLENGCAVVMGSRNKKDAPGARQEIKQNILKRFLGITGNKIIQTATIRGIRDTQCGFKAFTADTINKIMPKAEINRWAFDVEFLTIAKKLNLKIGVIPVVWKNSSESRVSILGYFFTLWEVVKIKWNLINGKYY
ncbi:MAG: dolichyl-phosphate beta-glucosyltransferase, partial [bacterium]